MHKRRREFKKRARCVLKTHYWLFVMLCLIAGMIGTEFTTSVKLGKDAAVSYAEAENTVNRLTTDNLIGAFYDNLEEFNEGKEAEQRARIDEKKKRYEEESKKNENAVLGRSRGVFSGIVNKAASGEYIVTLAVAVRSLVGSDNIAAWLLIVVSLALIFFVQTFIVDVYQIVVPDAGAQMDACGSHASVKTGIAHCVGAYGYRGRCQILFLLSGSLYCSRESIN